MIAKYFAMRVFGVYLYIAIAAVIILIGFLAAVKSAIGSFRWHRKTSLLEKKGYERYLHSVPSVGDGAFYGWKKEGHNRILESDMERMAFKELKRQVNETKGVDN